MRPFRPVRQNDVELRRLPFPYRACLAIASDIDYTATRERFREIQDFMREVLGYSFSNTFFPFHEKGEFSLLSGVPEDREAILEAIRKGEIDAMHSYGEKESFSREDARRVLDVLKENGLSLDFWIDHAASPSNFCKWRFPGRGDVPGAREYHADLTLHQGIRFIWTERLTNIIGQEVPFRLSHFLYLFDILHPLASLSETVKTAVKTILGFLGSAEYEHFKTNDLLRLTTLADGQNVFELTRYNHSYKKAGEGRRSSFLELANILSEKMLNRLKSIGGSCVVYVHLGKDFYPRTVEGVCTAKALRRLRNECEKGEIQVVSASHLMKYLVVCNYLDWSAEDSGKDCLIRIAFIQDPVRGAWRPSTNDLGGMTFYLPSGRRARIFTGDEEITQIRRHGPDFSGRESVTIEQ